MVGDDRCPPRKWLDEHRLEPGTVIGVHFQSVVGCDPSVSVMLQANGFVIIQPSASVPSTCVDVAVNFEIGPKRAAQETVTTKDDLIFLAEMGTGTFADRVETVVFI